MNSPLPDITRHRAEPRPGEAVRARMATNYARFDRQDAIERSQAAADRETRRLAERSRALDEREARLHQDEIALSSRVAEQGRRETAALETHVAARLSKAEAILAPPDSSSSRSFANDMVSAHDGRTARAIIESGNARRNETADIPLPSDPTARAIVLAGRKRRGEVTDDDTPLVDPATLSAEDRRNPLHNGQLAAQIVAAGRIRRGEV